MLMKLAGKSIWQLGLSLIVLASLGFAEDPYRFFDWNITYGDIYPLGVRQQVSYLYTCTFELVFHFFFFFFNVY